MSSLGEAGSMADVAERTIYLCQLCSGRPGFWLDQTTNTPIALENEHLYGLTRCNRCNGNVAEARKQLELERQGFFAGPATGSSITEHLTFEPKLGRSLCGKEMIGDLITPPTQHHHLIPNLCKRCRRSVYALSKAPGAGGRTLYEVWQYEVWKKTHRPARPTPKLTVPDDFVEPTGKYGWKELIPDRKQEALEFVARGLSGEQAMWMVTLGRKSFETRDDGTIYFTHRHKHYEIARDGTCRTQWA